MRNALFTVSFALSVACNGSAVSEYAGANLERAVVSPDEELERDQRYDWVGEVAVNGSGADWTLAVDGVNVAVHSPAHSDLSGLDGLELVVSVAPEAVSNELSLAVTTMEGDLHYLLEPVTPGAMTEETFGLGLVAPASALGEVSEGGWDLSLTSAWFRTDTGDVELLPGEPQEVSVYGVTYRATLIAAFTADLVTSQVVSCSGASERLAFELVRVEPGTADLGALRRAEGVDLPTSTCAAAP
jgi:hypothetical protein